MNWWRIKCTGDSQLLNSNSPIVRNMGKSASNKIIGILLLYAGAAQADGVHVDISGVEAGIGQVVVSVWDSEENYLNKAYLTVTVPVKKLTKGVFRVTFNEDLPLVCVINVFYDINSNGELDTSWIGIPEEPVGITNNIRGNFGPPDYEKAKVHITGHERVFKIHVEDI